MTHIRQELTFGLIGFFGRLACLAEFLFRCDVVRNILVYPIHVLNFAIRISNDLPHCVNPYDFSIDRTFIGIGRFIMIIAAVDRTLIAFRSPFGRFRIRFN